MTTVNEVINHLQKLAGHDLNFDEGVHHGSADATFTGATVCWMANPDSIEAAGRAGHQLIISHESLYYPYDIAVADKAPPEWAVRNPPPDWPDWPVNRQRREALEKYKLTFLRVHGTADEISILDDFATMLGMGAPVYVKGWVKVYEIQPTPLGQLVERVKKCMGLPHVRVSAAGSMDRIVHRVGLPWGGLGLVGNIIYQHWLQQQGCDVFIAGETDNYAFRFAQECGIPMIETSHETSENPGMRTLTTILAKQFPQAKWAFYENPRVWEFA